MPGYTPNIFNQYIHVAYILFQENFMLKTIHQSGCVKGTPNNKKNAAINFEASQWGFVGWPVVKRCLGREGNYNFISCGRNFTQRL